MSARWPIHPLPYCDEALSSWIERLAGIYDMDLKDFLRYEFGIFLDRNGIDLIDLNPSISLLQGLSERTGVELSVIKSLTAQVYIPLLVDALDNSTANSFYNYISQFNIFFVPKEQFFYNLDIIPWLDTKKFITMQGCSGCLSEDQEPYLRLYWRFPWMMTCPKHKLLLEPIHFYKSNLSTKRSFWFRNSEHKLIVPEALCAMDAVTLKAVTEGITEIPSRRLHGGVWLRVLRTIIEELSTPLIFLRFCAPI